MSYRIRKFETEPFITELEHKEHKVLSNESRRHNIEIFWDMQRLIENKFIGKALIQR
jgi:hypothetical protein